jgi:hypothetical protein
MIRFAFGGAGAPSAPSAPCTRISPTSAGARDLIVTVTARRGFHAHVSWLTNRRVTRMGGRDQASSATRPITGMSACAGQGGASLGSRNATRCSRTTASLLPCPARSCSSFAGNARARNSVALDSTERTIIEDAGMDAQRDEQREAQSGCQSRREVHHSATSITSKGGVFQRMANRVMQRAAFARFEELATSGAGRRFVHAEPLPRDRRMHNQASVPRRKGQAIRSLAFA